MQFSRCLGTPQVPFGISRRSTPRTHHHDHRLLLRVTEQALRWFIIAHMFSFVKAYCKLSFALFFPFPSPLLLRSSAALSLHPLPAPSHLTPSCPSPPLFPNIQNLPNIFSHTHLTNANIRAIIPITPEWGEGGQRQADRQRYRQYQAGPPTPTRSALSSPPSRIRPIGQKEKGRTPNGARP